MSPLSAYHEHGAISSHKLGDFRRSPLYFYRKHIMKLVSDREQPWMLFGRAVHSLTLEGRAAFDNAFTVCPEEFLTESGAVSTSKAAKAWKADQGDKAVIGPRDLALAETLAKRVHANPHAKALLAVGQPEVERFDKHRPTGIDLKGKCDWLTPDSIIDLKTCGDLDAFADDARKYGYAEQIAFYLDLFERTRGYLVAVEKGEPYRVGVWEVSQAAVAQGILTNDAALARMKTCYDLDEWPGDPTGIMTLGL